MNHCLSHPFQSHKAKGHFPHPLDVVLTDSTRLEKECKSAQKAGGRWVGWPCAKGIPGKKNPASQCDRSFKLYRQQLQGPGSSSPWALHLQARTRDTRGCSSSHSQGKISQGIPPAPHPTKAKMMGGGQGFLLRQKLEKKDSRSASGGRQSFSSEAEVLSVLLNQLKLLGPISYFCPDRMFVTQVPVKGRGSAESTQ